VNEAAALALYKSVRSEHKSEAAAAVLNAVAIGHLTAAVCSGVGAIGALTETVASGVGAIGELAELIRAQSGFMRDSINALAHRK
jgi:hypothetical protein